MDIKIIEKQARDSLAGTITFPEVVKILLEQNVEMYHVDLMKLEKRYYGQDGQTHVEPMNFEPYNINAVFNASEVISALKSVQGKQISYKDFLHKIMVAGCYYYIACLSGKQVIYLGKSGAMHIEHFPGSK